MYKKKILLSSMLIVVPFFVKGFFDGTKCKQFKKTVCYELKQSDFLNLYDIHALPTDNLGVCCAKNHIEFKIRLHHELGYGLPMDDFSLITSEDSTVTYTRPDNSGFVRKYGSRTWRNQNPGAIRTSPFACKMGAIGSAGGFAVFPNEETGMIALKELLRTDGYAKLTIYNAIHKYAPFCDSNDPIRYQRHLYERTGIDANRKLSDLSDAEMDKIAETIKVLEGWKPGKQEAFGLVADVLKEIQSNQKQRNS